MKVLIADDDEGVRAFLGKVVEPTAESVVVVEDGEEAWERYREMRPELVISDIRMPKMDGLELLRKVRAESKDTFFVLLTGAGSQQDAIDALEWGANHFLVKPFRPDQLRSLLAKYARMVRNRSHRATVTSMVTRRALTLSLPNQLELVTDTVDFLLNDVVGLIPADERFGIQLGLYELIVNAIEHGNLGLSFEEKRKALLTGPQRLNELIAERCRDPQFANRRVTIHFRMTPHECEWLIEDQGEGFDFKSLRSSLADLDEESVSGRGIFLARFHFTVLEYLGNGNRVRAVWKKKTSNLSTES